MIKQFGVTIHIIKYYSYDQAIWSSGQIIKDALVGGDCDVCNPTVKQFGVPIHIDLGWTYPVGYFDQLCRLKNGNANADCLTNCLSLASGCLVRSMCPPTCQLNGR